MVRQRERFLMSSVIYGETSQRKNAGSEAERSIKGCRVMVASHLCPEGTIVYTNINTLMSQRKLDSQSWDIHKLVTKCARLEARLFSAYGYAEGEETRQEEIWCKAERKQGGRGAAWWGPHNAGKPFVLTRSLSPHQGFGAGAHSFPPAGCCCRCVPMASLVRLQVELTETIHRSHHSPSALRNQCMQFMCFASGIHLHIIHITLMYLHIKAPANN